MDKRKENPWLSIWRKPEKTIEHLLNQESNQHIWLISGLFSFSIALPVLVGLGHYKWIDKYSWQTAILVIGISFLGSILYVHVGAHILSHIGRWFHGSAKPNEVRTALAWSSIPLVIAIPFWLPSTFLVWSTTNNINVTSNIISSLLSLWILFIAIPCKYIVNFLYIYSFALLIRMLASVHQFSKWKAFFTILFGIMLIAVLIVICSKMKFA